MAKFKFPLQAVLEYREHIERQKQLVVARLHAERRAGEATITGYQAQIRSGKDDLRRVLAPGSDAVDARSARLQASASLHLQLKARRSALSLAGVLQRLGEAQKALARAAVDRRAMEKLKENRLHAWTTEQSRREDAAIDEIGTIRAFRRGSMEGGGR